MHYYKHPVYGDIELVPHPFLAGRSVGYHKGVPIIEVDTPEDPEEVEPQEGGMVPDGADYSLTPPPIGGRVSEAAADCTEDMTALSKDPHD